MRRLLSRRPNSPPWLGEALIGIGYREVEKCKVAAAGAPCVTDDEIVRAEAEERKR